MPFYWASEQELGCVIMHQKVMFPKKLFGELSDECMDLLKKMLEKEPGVRITAGTALEHSWFAQEQSKPE
jgi:serine/threonine protein kinase